MIDQTLLNYIKEQSQQGFTIEQIKNALLSAGWQLNVVEEALKIAFANPVTSEKEAISVQQNSASVSPQVAPTDAFVTPTTAVRQRQKINPKMLIIIGLSILLVAALIFLILSLDFNKKATTAPLASSTPTVNTPSVNPTEGSPNSNLRTGPMVPIY